MGSGLSVCVSSANIEIIEEGGAEDDEAAASVQSSPQTFDGGPSDQRTTTTSSDHIPFINGESEILLYTEPSSEERMSTPQRSNSRSTSRRRFVNIDDMDANQREMFEHTAMSLGMDWDDFVYNVLYFGNGQEPNLDAAISNARDETLALHSENNTPYKLRPASSAIIQDLKVDVLTDQKDLHDPDCSVCKEHLELGSAVIFLPSCVHCFHKDCLIRWIKLQGFCPICRTTIGPKNSPESRGEIKSGIRIDLFRETSFEDLVRLQQPHSSRSSGGGGGKFRANIVQHPYDEDLKTDRTAYDEKGDDYLLDSDTRSYVSDGSQPASDRDEQHNHHHMNTDTDIDADAAAGAVIKRCWKDDLTLSPATPSREKLPEAFNLSERSRKSLNHQLNGFVQDHGPGFHKSSTASREGSRREQEYMKQHYSAPRNSLRSDRSLHGLKYVSSMRPIESDTMMSDDAQTRCSDSTTLN